MANSVEAYNIIADKPAKAESLVVKIQRLKETKIDHFSFSTGWTKQSGISRLRQADWVRGLENVVWSKQDIEQAA